MTNFDVDTLRDLHDLQEVVIRTEKHPKSAIVIWVAVTDNEVFVRSWLGAKGRWYKDLAAGGNATLGSVFVAVTAGSPPFVTRFFCVYPAAHA